MSRRDSKETFAAYHLHCNFGYSHDQCFDMVSHFELWQLDEHYRLGLSLARRTFKGEKPVKRTQRPRYAPPSAQPG